MCDWVKQSALQNCPPPKKEAHTYLLGFVVPPLEKGEESSDVEGSSPQTVGAGGKTDTAM